MVFLVTRVDDGSGMKRTSLGRDTASSIYWNCRKLLWNQHLPNPASGWRNSAKDHTTSFFLLTMANGKAVAARIPHPNAGPVVLTTASEIATMDFLREILQVPVPKVLAWNATVNFANRVGAEYIIMEHAPGKNLADYRADMSLERKVQVMEDIVSIQQKLLSVKFSGYGCLYFRNNAPPGSHPAMVKGDGLSPELKESIAGQFSIGPVVNTVLA